MYRIAVFLVVAAACVTAVPVKPPNSGSPAQNMRMPPGGFQMPPGGQSAQSVADMARRMNLDAVLSNAMGRPVNVQELLAQVANDTSGGDPWTKVAERLFGKQAVANAMAQVKQMQDMMARPGGQARMMQQLDQTMQSLGGVPYSSISAALNRQGPLSNRQAPPSVFNAPGTGGVRMGPQPPSGGRPQ